MNKKSRILPVVYPIIASNTEHGYLLSGVLSNSKAWAWVMGNYVNQILYSLRFGLDMNFYPLMNHTHCPCIDYMRISRKLIFHKWDNFIQFISEMIDDEYYIMIFLDRFYIPVSGEYKKVHNWHPSLIYGYDYEKKIIYIADFYLHRKFSFENVSFYFICQAFSSDQEREMPFINQRYFGSDDAIIYKNRNEFLFKFDINSFKTKCINYLNSTNLSRIYGLSDSYYFGTSIFGLSTMKEVRKLILNQYDSDEINVKLFTVPKERTNLMLERLKYLEKNGYIGLNNTVNQKFLEIQKLYNIMMGLVIKYNITNDKRNLEKIDLYIEQVNDAEEVAFEQLIGILKC